MSRGEASCNVDRVAISYRDLAGGAFRLFLTGISFLAWSYWSQLTGQLEKVGKGVESLNKTVAEQNTRIAIIEVTTTRTAALVEQDNAAIRLNSDRLTKLESRVK